MAQERRQYQRIEIDEPVIISLGKTKAGLLFDISEGGLSVRGLIAQARDEFFPVAFTLPAIHRPVQTRVSIAWTNDGNNRTGMRFLDMTDRTRELVRAWISGRHGSC